MDANVIDANEKQTGMFTPSLIVYAPLMILYGFKRIPSTHDMWMKIVDITSKPHDEKYKKVEARTLVNTFCPLLKLSHLFINRKDLEKTTPKHVDFVYYHKIYTIHPLANIIKKNYKILMIDVQDTTIYTDKYGEYFLVKTSLVDILIDKLIEALRKRDIEWGSKS